MLFALFIIAYILWFSFIVLIRNKVSLSHRVSFFPSLSLLVQVLYVLIQSKRLIFALGVGGKGHIFMCHLLNESQHMICRPLSSFSSPPPIFFSISVLLFSYNPDGVIVMLPSCFYGDKEWAVSSVVYVSPLSLAHTFKHAHIHSCCDKSPKIWNVKIVSVPNVLH